MSSTASGEDILDRAVIGQLLEQLFNLLLGAVHGGLPGNPFAKHITRPSRLRATQYLVGAHDAVAIAVGEPDLDLPRTGGAEELCDCLEYRDDAAPGNRGVDFKRQALSSSYSVALVRRSALSASEGSSSFP